MDKSSPMSRQERFEVLCAEIDSLIAKYPAMPPGRARAACQEAIDMRMREIEEINAAEREDFESAMDEQSVQRVSLWHPSGIVGTAMVLVGALASLYIAVVIGLVMLAVYISTISSHMRSPEQNPPAPTARRYEWRP